MWHRSLLRALEVSALSSVIEALSQVLNKCCVIHSRYRNTFGDPANVLLKRVLVSNEILVLEMFSGELLTDVPLMRDLNSKAC